MAKRTNRKKVSPQASSSRPAQERRGILSAKPAAISLTLPAQIVAIVVAVGWIYWPALRGDYLWDDDRYISNNYLLQTVAGLEKIWLRPGITADYYPVQATVQWVQWHLWGFDTLGYHVTNVVLHVISSLLVWRLLSKFRLRLAWLGGLLFAIHPVQVESVAWMAELKNTLSLPPLLWAMCLYIDYDEEKRPQQYQLALGLFIIALLCKLSVVMFPLVILLYVWWKRGRIRWEDWKDSAPFFAVAAVLGAVSLQSGPWDQQFNHIQAAFLPAGGMWGRLTLAGQAFSFYFSKIFLPVNLLPIYPMWPVDYTSPLHYLPWLVWGAVFFWLWTKRETWGRHALLGLGFFLVNLTACPGFIPPPNMEYAWVMDHFLYLPIIGLIGLVVAGLGQLQQRLPGFFPFWGVGILSMIAAWLIWQSHAYAGRFIDQETLWTYTLQRNPQAWLAHCNLGKALLLTNHVPEALEQLEQAVTLNPVCAEAHNNLAVALLRVNRGPEAIEQCELALKISPSYADAHNNLGINLMQTGRLSEAADQYNQALKINPDDADAHYNLGVIYSRTGHMPEAADEFAKALTTKPSYTKAHNNLGVALFQLGRKSEAIEQFEQALQIDPTYTEARNNLTKAQALLQADPARN
jgi:tetratricopeptide (TPR) repeat protein